MYKTVIEEVSLKQKTTEERFLLFKKTNLPADAYPAFYKPKLPTKDFIGVYKGMIRGVNKRIVEVCKTDSDYFERIFFIVREDKLAEDEKLLKAKADEYLKNVTLDKAPTVKKKREKQPEKTAFFSDKSSIGLWLVRIGSVGLALGLCAFFMSFFF